MKEESKTGKGRFWICEMYEDSRPENWREELEKTMIKICISPKHDKDKYEKDTEEHKKGDIKKAHWHILLCFEGPTTYNNALRIAKKVGANIVFQAYSIKGSCEYFIHKNNPEKAQYSEEDYIYLNGFNIDDINQLTTNEVEEIKRGIVNIIRQQNIHEYSVIYDFLLDNEMYTMTQVLSNNTMFFVAYIKSKKFIDIK